jgi:hypothetical protein
VKWVDFILFPIIQKPEVRCDYFKWRDPEICVYGQRVVSRLRDWHENLKALKAEHELSRINRLDEVGKYKNEVEKCRAEVEKCRAEVEKYKFKLQRQKDKFRSVERKYQIALVCSWVMLMWLLVYPSYSREFLPLRMMLQ